MADLPAGDVIVRFLVDNSQMKVAIAQTQEQLAALAEAGMPIVAMLGRLDTAFTATFANANASIAGTSAQMAALDGQSVTLGATMVATSETIGGSSGIAGAADAAALSFNSFGQGANALTTILKGLGLVGAGLGVFEVLKTAGSFEQLNIAMGTLLKSQPAATAYLDQLRTFEPHTPYTMESLSSWSRMLLAAKLSTDQLIPSLRAVGDAGSALGASSEDVQRFMLQLMELNNNVPPTRVFLAMARDIPGLNPYQIVADQFKTTIEDVKKKASSGEYRSSEITQALLTGMEQQYAGSMARQMQTLFGQLTNLMTKAWNAAINVGTPLLPMLKNMSAGLGQLFDNLNSSGFSKNLGAFISNLAKDLAPVVQAMTGLVSLFVKLSSWAMGNPVTSTIFEWIVALKLLTSSFATTLNGVAGLTKLIVSLFSYSAATDGIVAGWGKIRAAVGLATTATTINTASTEANAVAQATDTVAADAATVSFGQLALAKLAAAGPLVITLEVAALVYEISTIISKLQELKDLKDQIASGQTAAEQAGDKLESEFESAMAATGQTRATIDAGITGGKIQFGRVYTIEEETSYLWSHFHDKMQVWEQHERPTPGNTDTPDAESAQDNDDTVANASAKQKLETLEHELQLMKDLKDQSNTVEENHALDEKIKLKSIEVAQAKALQGIEEEHQNNLINLGYDVETGQVKEEKNKAAVKQENYRYKIAKDAAEEEFNRTQASAQNQQEIDDTAIKRALERAKVEYKVSEEQQKGAYEVDKIAHDIQRLDIERGETIDRVQQARIQGEEDVKQVELDNAKEIANKEAEWTRWVADGALHGDAEKASREHAVAIKKASIAYDHAQAILDAQEAAKELEKAASRQEVIFKAKIAFSEENLSAALSQAEKLAESNNIKLKMSLTHNPKELIDLQVELDSLNADAVSSKTQDSIRKMSTPKVGGFAAMLGMLPGGESLAEILEPAVAHAAKMADLHAKDDGVLAKTAIEHDKILADMKAEVALAQQQYDLSAANRSLTEQEGDAKRYGEFVEAMTGDPAKQREAEMFAIRTDYDKKRAELALQYEQANDAERKKLDSENLDAASEANEKLKDLGAKSLLADLQKSKDIVASLFQNDELLSRANFSQGMAFQREAMGVPTGSPPIVANIHAVPLSSTRAENTQNTIALALSGVLEMKKDGNFIATITPVIKTIVNKILVDNKIGDKNLAFGH